jgi:hypothetical protein
MPHRELARLLGRCLAFRLDFGDLAGLRAQLLSSPALWDDLTAFAMHEGLAHALERRLRARGLLPSEFLPPGVAELAADRRLRAAALASSRRREALAGHLRQMIQRLNRIDIQPIILKGARSLLTGEPDWRYLRDFDLPPLVRGDFPAFVEIHRRAGNQYVRTLLPTGELARASEPVSDGGIRFALLPIHLHALSSTIISGMPETPAAR